MTLRNVKCVSVKNLTPEQKKDLGINVNSGLVAVETHNIEYEQKGVLIRSGLVNYILNGE